MNKVWDASDMLFYAMDGHHATWAGMRLTLDAPIARKAMENALAKVRKRMPYIFSTLLITETDISLVPNEKPFLIHEDPLDYVIDYSTNDGFLLRLSILDNHLTLYMFHGLSDGGGLSVFLKLLLSEYYKELGEEVIPPEDLWDIDGPIDEEETIKPISKLPENTVPADSSTSKFHTIKGKASGDFYTYSFSLNKEKFVSYFSSIDSSPNAMGVIALGLAIKKIDGNLVKDNIDISITINTKPFLKCPKAIAPSLMTNSFHFNETTLEMDNEMLHTCVKGKLIHDTVEELLFSQLAGIKQMGEICEYLPSVDAKRLLAQQATEVPRSTAVVSYTGAVQWGSMERHIKRITAFADSVSPLMELFCTKDTFDIAFSSRTPFHAYAEAIRTYFNDLGFECTPMEELVFKATADNSKKLKAGLNKATLQMLLGLRKYKKSQKH